MASFEMLPEHALHPYALSSTAVQYILADGLPPQESAFWTLPEEYRREEHEDDEVK